MGFVLTKPPAGHYRRSMSLTMGNGPFAKPLAGTLNFDLAAAAPASVIYLYGLDRRIRGEFAGEIIVDTVRATMVHETRLLPQWYLPLADVRPGVLIESDSRTHCPYKGDARYWHLSLNGRTVHDAAWSYPEPLPAPPISGGWWRSIRNGWMPGSRRTSGWWAIRVTPSTASTPVVPAGG